MINGHTILIIIAVAALVNILFAAATSWYGFNHYGFRQGPIFLVTLFLGFPIVLLAITIAGRLVEYLAAAEKRDIARYESVAIDATRDAGARRSASSQEQFDRDAAALAAWTAAQQPSRYPPLPR
jgi:uncharacterized membrane protein